MLTIGRSVVFRNVDYSNRYFLWAVVNKKNDLVKTLLRWPQVDPSYRTNLALRIACEKGYLSIVHTLLQDSRVDPSAIENEAIFQASYNGNADIVAELMKHPKCDPSDRYI
jgi:hypothetical protein